MEHKVKKHFMLSDIALTGGDICGKQQAQSGFASDIAAYDAVKSCQGVVKYSPMANVISPQRHGCGSRKRLEFKVVCAGFEFINRTWHSFITSIVKRITLQKRKQTANVKKAMEGLQF